MYDVCMVITYSRVWINRARLLILLVENGDTYFMMLSVVYVDKRQDNATLKIEQTDQVMIYI